VTSTTNTPPLVSKFARKVAGATSLSFAGVLSAGLIAAVLAVAGLAVAGFCVAGVVVAGLGAGFVCVDVVVAGFDVDCARGDAIDNAMALSVIAATAFEPTLIVLLP